MTPPPAPPALKLPPAARLTLYLVSAVAALLVSYALAKGWIGTDEMTLFAGLGAIPNLIAAGNVTATRARRRRDVEDDAA